jgi:hypothetical protein
MTSFVVVTKQLLQSEIAATTFELSWLRKEFRKVTRDCDSGVLSYRLALRRHDDLTMLIQQKLEHRRALREQLRRV